MGHLLHLRHQALSLKFHPRESLGRCVRACTRRCGSLWLLRSGGCGFCRVWCGVGLFEFIDGDPGAVVEPSAPSTAAGPRQLVASGFAIGTLRGEDGCDDLGRDAHPRGLHPHIPFAGTPRGGFGTLCVAATPQISYARRESVAAVAVVGCVGAVSRGEFGVVVAVVGVSGGCIGRRGCRGRSEWEYGHSDNNGLAASAATIFVEVVPGS